MLKKAKSFREKFRRGALNRASASTSALRATLARSLSITGKDRKRGDAGTPDKQTENGEVAGGGTRPTKLCPDEKSLSLLNAESVHPVRVSSYRSLNDSQMILSLIGSSIDLWVILVVWLSLNRYYTLFELIWIESHVFYMYSFLKISILKRAIQQAISQGRIEFVIITQICAKREKLFGILGWQETIWGRKDLGWSSLIWGWI